MKTKLKDYRKRTGYSQEEFADLIGVNRGTYRNWEQGVRDFSLEKAVDFADIFGCTLDQLFGRTPMDR